jgi:hypothetical protein
MESWLRIIIALPLCNLFELESLENQTKSPQNKKVTLINNSQADYLFHLLKE